MVPTEDQSLTSSQDQVGPLHSCCLQLKMFHIPVIKNVRRIVTLLKTDSDSLHTT